MDGWMDGKRALGDRYDGWMKRGHVMTASTSTEPTKSALFLNSTHQAKKSMKRECRPAKIATPRFANEARSRSTPRCAMQAKRLDEPTC